MSWQVGPWIDRNAIEYNDNNWTQGPPSWNGYAQFHPSSVNHQNPWSALPSPSYSNSMNEFPQPYEVQNQQIYSAQPQMVNHSWSMPSGSDRGAVSDALTVDHTVDNHEAPGNPATCTHASLNPTRTEVEPTWDVIKNLPKPERREIASALIHSLVHIEDIEDFLFYAKNAAPTGLAESDLLCSDGILHYRLSNQKINKLSRVRADAEMQKTIENIRALKNEFVHPSEYDILAFRTVEHKLSTKDGICGCRKVDLSAFQRFVADRYVEVVKFVQPHMKPILDDIENVQKQPGPAMLIRPPWYQKRV